MIIGWVFCRFIIYLFKLAFSLLSNILSLLSSPISTFRALISSLISQLNSFSTYCTSLGLLSNSLTLTAYLWLSSFNTLISLLSEFTNAKYCSTWLFRYAILSRSLERLIGWETTSFVALSVVSWLYMDSDFIVRADSWDCSWVIC